MRIGQELLPILKAGRPRYTGQCWPRSGRLLL